MTKEEYVKQRAELMVTANAALDKSDCALAKETREKVEALDKAFEAEAKERAEIEALKDREIVKIENKGVNLDGRATVVESTKKAPAKDDEQLYRAAFARVMMGKAVTDEEERRVFNVINPALSISAQTSADHQVVIPTTLVQEIWQEAAKIHPVLSFVNMTTVKGKISYPKENGKGSDAAWYDEETEVADGTVATASIELDSYELAKAIPVSWKLKNMAIDAFLVYLRDNLAAKMGDALANAIFTGKGVAAEGDIWKSQPLGIITAMEAELSTPQVLTWTPTTDVINYAKLTAFMAKLKTEYATGAVIFATNSFIWTYLANVLDSNGRPYFITDPTSGGVGRLFGKTVYEEDAAPTDGMVIANFGRGYKMNSQENVTMYTEDHIKTRITDYMAYAEIDGKPISTAPFVYLKKSA